MSHLWRQSWWRLAPCWSCSWSVDLHRSVPAGHLVGGRVLLLDTPSSALFVLLQPVWSSLPQLPTLSFREFPPRQRAIPPDLQPISLDWEETNSSAAALPESSRWWWCFLKFNPSWTSEGHERDMKTDEIFLSWSDSTQFAATLTLFIFAKIRTITLPQHHFLATRLSEHAHKFSLQETNEFLLDVAERSAASPATRLFRQDAYLSARARWHHTSLVSCFSPVVMLS